MAVTLQWPIDLIPNEMTLTPISNSKAFPSPFSGSTQTVGYPGAHWAMDLSFTKLIDETRPRLEVLIAQLDGESGRIMVWDFAAKLVSSPQPVYGAPIVTLATSLSSNIMTRGWQSNQRVLKLGGWVQIGDELKRVLADVYSDISGQAVIPISPMLRNDYANGTPLIVSRPCGKFKLKDNSQGASHRKPSKGSISLSLVEAFYP